MEHIVVSKQLECSFLSWRLFWHRRMDAGEWLQLGVTTVPTPMPTGPCDERSIVDGPDPHKP